MRDVPPFSGRMPFRNYPWLILPISGSLKLGEMKGKTNEKS
jgi:hypothetical protein